MTFKYPVAVLVFLGAFLVGISTVSAHTLVDWGDLGLHEGDIVGSNNLNDPDIYIVNEFGFRRLFLSPKIFGYYGHLTYAGVKRMDSEAMEQTLPISGLFRNCETDDQRVYALQFTGEDTAVLRWVDVSGAQAAASDSEFFQKVFCINTREFDSYPKGGDYHSLAEVPVYKRTGLSPSVNTTNIPLSLPSGFRISLFTPKAIGPLRFMAFSPDGILFVSMPGSAGLYSSARVDDGTVFALPDRNGDGIADETKRVLTNLHIPHGLAFHGNYLYVAEEATISRYPYLGGGSVGARQVIFAGLPTDGVHLSRTIAFSPSGKLFVTVGSSCNACEQDDDRFATVWEMNDDGSNARVYARGMRSTVGIAFNPDTGEPWTTDNGRDYLGADIPPDEINIIRDGKNYGWPYCYANKIVDPLYGKTAFCSTTEPSVWNMQAHSAPLGLAFIKGNQFPAEWKGDLLVARHGSFDRAQPVGYDVIRLDVQDNRILGEYPFITGWLTSKNVKLGRPVDVAFGPDGALYISDDKANIIYRVTKMQ